MIIKYYRDKLNKIGLLYFFDLPDDFDIYYYKLNNPDIMNISILDSIFHYIRYGIYEGRIYNKSKITKDTYLNNFYISSISKLKNIDNIHLPVNFNIFYHILFNNQLDKINDDKY